MKVSQTASNRHFRSALRAGVGCGDVTALSCLLFDRHKLPKPAGNSRPLNARHKPAKEPLYCWEGVVSPASGVAGHTGPYKRSCGASGLTLQLFLVVLLHHLCDGSDCEEQVAISLLTMPICNLGRLSCDEALRFQAADILSHCVDAHSRRFADGSTAWPALKCHSMLRPWEKYSPKPRTNAVLSTFTAMCSL